MVYKTCFKMHSESFIFYSLLLSSFAMQLSYSQVTKNHTGLSHQIKEFVSCAKPRIYPNASKVHDFISDDLYVQRWLQTKDFNAPLACERFMEHLSWRQAEKIDTIDLEDWTYFRREYPQFINLGESSSKILVAERWLSDWDVRRAIVSGQRRKFLRWIIHLLEMTQRKFFEIRKDGNAKLIGAVEIVDLAGFNAWQHGCQSCLSIYAALNEQWAQQYPGLWKKVYMLNVGPVFRSFIDIGQQSSYDRNYIIKWLTHRKEWLPILDREIGRNQRSLRFGGSIGRGSIE